MKALRPFLRPAALALAGLSCASCMFLRTAEKGYRPVRTVQGETAYEAELTPEGQGGGLAVSAMVVGGGATSVFGPYRLQVTAVGREGVHRSFEIRRVRFRFGNGQTFVFGPEALRGSAVFKPGTYRGEVKAIRRAAQVFAADPKKEGTVTVEMDALVRTSKGDRAQTLRFVFTPEEWVRWESINIPWEIKKAIWKESREHPVTSWREGPVPVADR